VTASRLAEGPFIQSFCSLLEQCLACHLSKRIGTVSKKNNHANEECESVGCDAHMQCAYRTATALAIVIGKAAMTMAQTYSQNSSVAFTTYSSNKHLVNRAVASHSHSQHCSLLVALRF